MPVDVSDAGVRRIHELFLNVCARHANEPALFLPSTKMLTFKQLLAESRKVQHALAPLIESGKRDQLVGIYMERTTHFFASIFGAPAAAPAFGTPFAAKICRSQSWRSRRRSCPRAMTFGRQERKRSESSVPPGV